MFVCFILHIEKQNVNTFFEKMFGNFGEHFLILEREEKGEEKNLKENKKKRKTASFALELLYI